jgi:secreted trypsin-like serine protease
MTWKRAALGLVVALAVALSALPAGAITFGHLDGKRHPEVGAMVVRFDRGSPFDILCSGTLISPTVFLTASHCTAYLDENGIPPHNVWVTFDPTFDQGSALHRGTYHTNPLYGSGGASDTHDIAVIVLDHAVTGIEPARLPRAHLLDRLQASHRIQSATFTAVGYGTVDNDKTAGAQTFFFDGKRRYALQQFNALNKAWLRLSENPSTGAGGTCYGDSGGPHFLGGVHSNRIVALTVTGDSVCRATDVDYRVDTASARAFLGQFVALP